MHKRVAKKIIRKKILKPHWLKLNFSEFVSFSTGFIKDSELGTCGINLPSTSKIQVVLCFFFQVKVQVQVIGEYIFTKYKYKYVANTFQLLFNYFSNAFNK